MKDLIRIIAINTKTNESEISSLLCSISKDEALIPQGMRQLSEIGIPIIQAIRLELEHTRGCGVCFDDVYDASKNRDVTYEVLVNSLERYYK